MKKNWFFILMLSIAALALAGTAAWFSVFGLTQLFYGAGIGITILAASLEFAKLVTVSYVYRFWKSIKKVFRGFYIFAVVFIMFLTSMGIYGFLISGYQKSANKIELRDAQVRIAENKKTLFVNHLDRINKTIESDNNRINTFSNIRNSQERRIDTLYQRRMNTDARANLKYVNDQNEQLKFLNQDITEKMKQASVINDSISFYDQKIAELKASEVSNEISSYQFISDLTGISMNKVVNFVALIIIFVFDPLAIALLIGVNSLTMTQPEKEERDSFWSNLKGTLKRKKEEEEETKIEEEVIEETKPLEEKKSEEVIQETEPEPFSDSWWNKFGVHEDTKVEEENDIIEPEVETEPITEEKIQEGVDELVKLSDWKNSIIEPIQQVETEPEQIQNLKEEKQFLIKKEEPEIKLDDEFEPKKLASIKSRINVAHFVPNDHK